jgi:hypothetical protein
MADENAIGVCEKKILRVIFCPKRNGDLFRSRSNAELYQLFNEADITKRVRVNRLRWTRHVIKRPSEVPYFKSDFVDGKRLLIKAVLHLILEIGRW